VWCYVLLQISSTCIIGGLGTFSNIIINNLGFSYLQTQLLNIAQGAISIMIYIGAAHVARRTGQTVFTMLLWLVPAVVGTVVLMAVKVTKKNAGGLLICFYLTQFVLAEGNLIFSLISRNIAGQTKKSTTMAMTFVAFAAAMCLNLSSLFEPSLMILVRL